MHDPDDCIPSEFLHGQSLFFIVLSSHVHAINIVGKVDSNFVRNTFSKSSKFLQWHQSLSSDLIFPPHSTASPERDLPAMAVFHHYYDYLATSVHDSVSLASNVCSKRLLNREGRDQVVTTQTTIPLHQSLTFLGAVESRIAPEDNSRSLTEFCQAPETSPGLRVVTEEMRKDLGDCVLDLTVCGINC